MKLRFSDLRIKTKLIFLILIFLISYALTALVARTLFRSMETLNIVVNEQRVFLENFHHGVKHSYEYEIKRDTAILAQAGAHFQKAYRIAYSFSHFEDIMNGMTEGEWTDYFYHVFEDGVNNTRQIKMMARQIRFLERIDNESLTGVRETATDAYKLSEKVYQLIREYEQQHSKEKLAVIEQEVAKIDPITETFTLRIYELNNHIKRMLGGAIAGIFLILTGFATLIAILISKSIARPINTMVGNYKKIAAGNLKSAVAIGYKNEIGELSKAFTGIQMGLTEVVTLSKKIAKGDYSIRFNPKSEQDEFSPALNQMVRKLEETQINTTRENWVQNGIRGLDDQMSGNYTVRELSNKIITYLCDFLQIEMGAIYVHDDVLKHLEFTGSVGLKKELVPEKINIGEGLTGKAAQKNECRIIETNGRYHKIFSATGEIIPGKIYLIPMFYNGRIQAVLELAPINELSEVKINFLKSIKERIAINMEAAVARFRISELLAQAMEQSKILKARDEELSRELEENEQIRQKLSQKTILLDSMLNTLPDYVYFKDINSKFLRVSESMVKLFGAKSSDEIIGKSDFEFHTEKNARRYFSEEQEIIKNGRGFVDKLRQGIDEHGNELWTSVTKLPMFDKYGNCIGTFGISKDVTNIKKLEIEVQERNQELHQQQQALKDVNTKLVLQQEELKATNEALKTQEEELRVANEELAEQTKILAKSEKSLQVQQEELRLANQELETKTVLLEQQKKEISLSNDNLLKIQRELKQKAGELEQASQYKSDFLANMSHELRTPLNSMLILSKLLAGNKHSNLTEEQRKSIQVIHKSGNDLLELINEILDLSKIEAGKMKYEFSETPVDNIITELNQTFRPVAKNKNLLLILEKDNHFPTQVYTDKQRLMQIIKNLLSNALKFTSAGSIKVSFGLPGQSVLFINPELTQNNTFYVSVEDTGVGIPKEKVNGIFEAFQQADGSISRKFGGTGLGLSISKQLVQVMGGEIHVESAEGAGSVFTVYLPLDKELVESTVRRQEKKVNGDIPAKAEIPVAARNDDENLPSFISDDRDVETEGRLVLLLHNEMGKALELKSLCNKLGFRVIAASRISDGIMLARQFMPQAIIISAELNHSTEFGKLKENQVTKRLPVHLVSRIEDFSPETIEELKTPESSDFQEKTSHIEQKLSNEFRQVLMVEDDEATRQSIQALFGNEEIIIHEAKSGQQAYDMLSARPFDCMILDLGLPDFSGGELLKKLKSGNVPIPNVIIHTARELNSGELRELRKYSDSIVIKGVKSDERLMDEVTLFLHQVEHTMTKTYRTKSGNLNGAGFKGKKVLIVDDDIRNVFALAQILEEREIEVLEAENGKVAVETVKNNSDIDLILMDIMMPVMNGYDAMKEIRKIPGPAEIPIITITAKAMKEDYQKAIDCGANDYISKPVDVDKLLSLLKIWLFK